MNLHVTEWNTYLIHWLSQTGCVIVCHNQSINQSIECSGPTSAPPGETKECQRSTDCRPARGWNRIPSARSLVRRWQRKEKKNKFVLSLELHVGACIMGWGRSPRCWISPQLHGTGPSSLCELVNESEKAPEVLWSDETRTGNSSATVFAEVETLCFSDRMTLPHWVGQWTGPRTVTSRTPSLGQDTDNWSWTSFQHETDSCHAGRTKSNIYFHHWHANSFIPFM